jgi:hypothetical protein
VFIFWVFDRCRECIDVFEAERPEPITTVCAFDDNAVLFSFPWNDPPSLMSSLTLRRNTKGFSFDGQCIVDVMVRPVISSIVIAIGFSCLVTIGAGSLQMCAPLHPVSKINVASSFVFDRNA